MPSGAAKHGRPNGGALVQAALSEQDIGTNNLKPNQAQLICNIKIRIEPTLPLIKVNA